MADYYGSIGGSGGGTSAGNIVAGEGIVATVAEEVLTISCEDATETNKGIMEIATDAEAVAHTATDKALVPSNLDDIFASPPDTGGTTPAAGTFTTITGNVTQTAIADTTLSGAPKVFVIYDGTTPYYFKAYPNK